MSKLHFKIKNGARVIAVSADPIDAEEGDIIFRSDLTPARFRIYRNSRWADLNDSSYNRLDVSNDSTSGASATIAAPANPFIRLTNALLTSVDGIPAGEDGQTVMLTNVTGNLVIFNDQTGTVVNQIVTGTLKPIKLKNGATILLTYDGISQKWRAISGSGGGEGNADSNLESLKNQFQDTYFNLLTPNIFRLDELTKLDISSNGAYNYTDETYDIDSGEFMLSINMIDTNEYVSTKILSEAEVSVYWKVEDVDPAAIYEISRNGGTDWQTISMERVGNTGMYRGYHVFSNTEVAPIVTYDLRLKITASASSKLEGYGIFYDKELSANVASGSLNIEVFEFSGSLNTYQFTLTKFVPHPDLLKVYDVNTGQVYDYGAFTFSGQTVVFDSGQFYQPGQTIKLRFIQMEGTAFDNSDVNALLMASNHLGSTDTSIDRSIAGRGIFLRRPDGMLREICIDNSDNIIIYSV